MKGCAMVSRSPFPFCSSISVMHGLVRACLVIPKDWSGVARFLPDALTLENADHPAGKTQPLRHHADHKGEQRLGQRWTLGFETFESIGP